MTYECISKNTVNEVHLILLKKACEESQLGMNASSGGYSVWGKGASKGDNFKWPKRKSENCAPV